MARIQISNDPSGRIIVSFPYNPLLIATAKTIPGHKWHPVEKYWSFPNTDETLDRILEAFQDREIHIDSSLRDTIPSLPLHESIASHPGSKSSKTKEIYTHVSTRNISRIRSPLDNLDLKKGGRNESNR